MSNFAVGLILISLNIQKHLITFSIWYYSAFICAWCFVFVLVIGLPIACSYEPKNNCSPIRNGLQVWKIVQSVKMIGMQNKISSILTYKNKSVFSNKYIYLWIRILFNSSTHNKCKSVYDLNITVRHLIYSVSVKCTMCLSQQSKIVTLEVLFLKRLIVCVYALLLFIKITM